MGTPDSYNEQTRSAEWSMEPLYMPLTPYVAIRINTSTNETCKLLVDFLRVGKVICAGCDSEFSIKHYQTLADDGLAARQGKWLEERLAADHTNKKLHGNFIYLPVDLLAQDPHEVPAAQPLNCA